MCAWPVEGGTKSDMCSALLLADGHHVDEADNLLSCTYVEAVLLCALKIP